MAFVSSFPDATEPPFASSSRAAVYTCMEDDNPCNYSPEVALRYCQVSALAGKIDCHVAAQQAGLHALRLGFRSWHVPLPAPCVHGPPGTLRWHSTTTTPEREHLVPARLARLGHLLSVHALLFFSCPPPLQNACTPNSNLCNGVNNLVGHPLQSRACGLFALSKPSCM